MIWEVQNYTKDAIKLDDIKDGDSFVICNFSQEIPETKIMSTKKNLKFLRCNMVNVFIQPTWKLKTVNTAKNEYEEVEIDGVVEKQVKSNIGKTDVSMKPLSKLDEDTIIKDITNVFAKEVFKKEIAAVGKL